MSNITPQTEHEAAQQIINEAVLTDSLRARLIIIEAIEKDVVIKIPNHKYAYLYLAYSAKSKIVKIGVTANTENRLQSLARDLRKHDISATDLRFLLVWDGPTEEVSKCESEIKRRFATYTTMGSTEWLTAPVEQVKEVFFEKIIQLEDAKRRLMVQYAKGERSYQNPLWLFTHAKQPVQQIIHGIHALRALDDEQWAAVKSYIAEEIEADSSSLLA